MPLVILWSLALALIKLLFDRTLLYQNIDTIIIFNLLDTFLRLGHWLTHKFALGLQNECLQLGGLLLHEKLIMQHCVE
jgi:hypothetical protein